MRVFLFLLLSLSLSLPASSQGTRGNTPRKPATGPLEALLTQIPLAAQGDIYLTDIAASRRQVDPLTTDAPSDDDRILAVYSSLMLPEGFGRDYLAMMLDRRTATIGFDIFGFDQMAGWGIPPDLPVIATGIEGHNAAMATRMAENGLQVRTVSGRDVWFIRDDNQMDLGARDPGPFGGHLGMAQRFVLDGDLLLYARSFGVIETLLTPGPTLESDADSAAILRAAYAFDAGDVINVVLVPEQPAKAPDPAMVLTLADGKTAAEVEAMIAGMPEFALPGLPRFLRFGLVMWQDGRSTTGAVVIPYIRRDTAETARENFAALLTQGTSVMARRPFDELLPAERRFEIVETGGRHVLILSFTDHADPAEAVNLMTFMRNPQNRLFQMYVARDLPLLIGSSE